MFRYLVRRRNQRSGSSFRSLVLHLASQSVKHSRQLKPGGFWREKALLARSLTTYSVQDLMILLPPLFKTQMLTPSHWHKRDLALTGFAGRKRWIAS
jgi:hypothetical protein